MIDHIRTGFLLAQEQAGRELAASSDIFSLEPLGPPPYERYIAKFAARSVLAGVSGPHASSGVFAVGIWFPSDYQARAAAPQVLTWLGPTAIHHPNIRAPFVCIGTIRPATPLVELVFRVWSLISYESYGLTNPLNGAAAAWARRHIARFPIDARPLKRRTASFKTRVVEKGSAA